LKVLVAANHGFCPGVKNAIMLARETLAQRKNVYSLGPIIHNEEVVHELAANGLKTVNTIDEIEADRGTVLIRSHGATLAQLEEIKSRGLDIVDATCILVKRLQKISLELSKQGYKVIIIGDKEHPEVQAVLGFTENVAVIANKADLNKLSSHSKLGVISQTTQSPDHFAKMLGEIVKKGFSELKVINTLCREAIKRQRSAVDLCKKVDIMFVLGGLHSANTRKLAELCKKYNNESFHLQNWEEFDKKVLFGKAIAGITAGASTPDRIIAEFVEKLRSFDSSGESSQ